MPFDTACIPFKKRGWGHLFVAVHCLGGLNLFGEGALSERDLTWIEEVRRVRGAKGGSEGGAGFEAGVAVGPDPETVGPTARAVRGGSGDQRWGPPGMR